VQGEGPQVASLTKKLPEGDYFGKKASSFEKEGHTKAVFERMIISREKVHQNEGGNIAPLWESVETGRFLGGSNLPIQ